MMLTRACFAFLVFVALQAQTAQSSVPPETIKLTYAWDPGLTATIETERTKTSVIDGKKTQTTGGLRYRVRVDPHPDGQLISYDRVEAVGRGAAPGLEELASSMMPSVIVGRDGSFLRVGDLSAIRAAINEFLAAAKSKASADIPPGAQAILDGLKSESVLTNLASAEWHTFVGAFVGFTGMIGKLEEFDSREPSPVIPDLLIPMRTSFGALKRVPCEPSDAQSRCVLMQIRSVIGPGGMEMMAQRMLQGVKDLEGVKYDRFDVTTELLSVIDPMTMKPYRIVHTKHVEFAMTHPRHGTSSGSQTEERVLRIKYPAL